jgi:hypothetical protein
VHLLHQQGLEVLEPQEDQLGHQDQLFHYYPLQDLESPVYLEDLEDLLVRDLLEDLEFLEYLVGLGTLDLLAFSLESIDYYTLNNYIYFILNLFIYLSI